MTIYIVRHGETAGNASGVVQFPDTPLNERGLEQAEAVGRRLANAGIVRVLTSDYARAQRTAQAISAQAGVPLEIEEGLRERNFGDLRGRPRSEVGPLMHAESFCPPNGESWPVFHDRVETAWKVVARTASAIPGHLAVVTHGLVCYSLVHRQLRLAPDMAPISGFANTSVTVVDSDPPFRVSVLNCCAHLDERTAPRGAAL